MPAGSAERSAYPSVDAWTDVIVAMRERWPDVTVCVIGKLTQDGRTTTRISTEEHARLVHLPCVVDGFDLELAEQLALVKACDAFLSTHTGFGLAALAVATPWVTIAGGRWPEYFFNGVPFHSVLPSSGVRFLQPVRASAAPRRRRGGGAAPAPCVPRAVSRGPGPDPRCDRSRGLGRG